MLAATGLSFLDTSHSRYRHQAAESELYLLDTHRTVDVDRQPYRYRLHPTVDIAAHQHENQYLPRVRFLHQVAEVADVVLRHETNGRLAATHERPYPSGKVPYQSDAECHLLATQFRGVRLRAVLLQPHHFRYLPFRQPAVWRVDSLLSETTETAGLRIVRETSGQ